MYDQYEVVVEEEDEEEEPMVEAIAILPEDEDYDDPYDMYDDYVPFDEYQ